MCWFCIVLYSIFYFKLALQKSSGNHVTTVFVDGLNEETTDETASLFFEHKRKSGGGDIEEFQRLTLKEALITFCSAKGILIYLICA